MFVLPWRMPYLFMSVLCHASNFVRCKSCGNAYDSSARRWHWDLLWSHKLRSTLLWARGLWHPDAWIFSTLSYLKRHPEISIITLCLLVTYRTMNGEYNIPVVRPSCWAMFSSDSCTRKLSCFVMFACYAPAVMRELVVQNILALMLCCELLQSIRSSHLIPCITRRTIWAISKGAIPAEHRASIQDFMLWVGVCLSDLGHWCHLALPISLLISITNRQISFIFFIPRTLLYLYIRILHTSFHLQHHYCTQYEIFITLWRKSLNISNSSRPIQHQLRPRLTPK